MAGDADVFHGRDQRAPDRYRRNVRRINERSDPVELRPGFCDLFVRKASIQGSVKLTGILMIVNQISFFTT